MPSPYALQPGEDFTGDPPQVIGDKTYARTNLRRVLVRTMRSGRTHITPIGRRYFQKYLVEVIPRIPVLKAVLGNGYRVYAPAPPSNYLPINAMEFQANAGEEGDAHAFLLGRIHTNGRPSNEDIKLQARQRTEAWLAARPTVAEKLGAERGLEAYQDYKIVVKVYDGYLLYDPRLPILMDEMVTHSERQATDVAVLLDRPLRVQQPYYDASLDHTGLSPLALSVPRGNCMVQQLAAHLERRNHTKGWEPMMTVEEVEAEMDAAFEELYEPGAFPYEDAQGWRQEGCTLRMLEHLAEKRGFAVWVFLTGKCVRAFCPKGWKSRAQNPVVALALHGERCFFYTGGRARELAQHHKPENSWIRPVVLQPPEWTPEPLVDFEPFNLTLFQQLYAAKEPRVLYAKELASLSYELRALKIPHKPWYGESLTYPVKIFVPLGPSKQILIVRLHEQWRMHRDVARAMEAYVGVPYTGQSLGILALQFIQHRLKGTRGTPPAKLKAELVELQKGRCNHCHDPLEVYELDHRKRLADGEQEDFTKPEKYQLLCKSCHAKKTRTEARGLGLSSRLSASVFDSFYREGSKPKQLSGRFPWPEPVDPQAVESFDVNGCRTNALEQSEAPLPIFCVTDDWEPLAAYAEGYDFYLVDNRPCWHLRVRYELEAGQLRPEDITWGLKASAHLDPKLYRKACQDLERCVYAARNDAWDEEPAKVYKSARLSCIGVYNKTEM